MSRAFGDRLLKQYVVADPDIQVLGCLRLSSNPSILLLPASLHFAYMYDIFHRTWQEEKVDDTLEFLILASDGLWDVVTNEVRPWLSVIFNVQNDRVC